MVRLQVRRNLSNAGKSKSESACCNAKFLTIIGVILTILNQILSHANPQDVQSALVLLTANTTTSISEEEHTTTSISTEVEDSRKLTFDSDLPVYFLDSSQLNYKDPFSASWLQTMEEFKTMNINVNTCESAAFAAYEGPKRHKLKMTLDLLDFSVEHLSKWWKNLEYDKGNHVAWKAIMERLDHYLSNSTTYLPIDPPSNQLPLQNTLAMIAYLPFGKTKEANDLTVVSLAATLESLRRATMGRVVVVGPDDHSRQFVEHSFRHAANKLQQPSAETTLAQIGHMEVAFVVATPDQYWFNPNGLNKNGKKSIKIMPRACLYGARKALELSKLPKNTLARDERKYLQTWFGDKGSDHWKYLYLTEPDSILQTRPSSLPKLKQEMDLNGAILAPHRLQPIPHHSDLTGMDSKYDLHHLQEKHKFPPVLELDALKADVCCDEHKGPDDRPGWDMAPCPNQKRWWACGFGPDHDEEDPHFRLRPYQLVRLQQGVGLTTIAGNLFGRRCVPSKRRSEGCQPPGME